MEPKELLTVQIFQELDTVPQVGSILQIISISLEVLVTIPQKVSSKDDIIY